MTALVIEILGYILVAAAAGFLLGYLTWGWSTQDRLSAARAEGALEARTSVDGDAGIRAQLAAAEDERARLEAELDRLAERLALHDGEPEPTPAPLVPARAAPAGGAAGGAPPVSQPAFTRAALDGLAMPAGSADIAAEPRAAAAGESAAGPVAGAASPPDADAPDLGLRRLILSDEAEPAAAATVGQGGGAESGTGPAAADTPEADGEADGAADGAAAASAGPAREPAGAGLARAPAFSALRQRAREGDEAFAAGPQASATARPDGAEVPRQGGFMLRRPRPAAGDTPDGGVRHRQDADDAAPGRAASAPEPADTPEDPARAPAFDGSERPVPAENLPFAGSASASEAGADGRPGSMPHPADQTLRTQRSAPAAAPAVADGPLAGPGAGPVAPAPAAAGEPGSDPGAAQQAPGPGAPPTAADESEPARDGHDPARSGPGGPAAGEDVADVPAGGAEARPGAPDAGGTGELPRPAEATLRTQRDAGPGQAPVVDEQVPPTSDAGTPTRDGLPAGRGEPPAAGDAGRGANGGAAPFPLLSGPPERPDELRRIRGIGRVMERHLNQQGIWLYRQIATLTPQGVEWLAGAIGGPPDRIRRDRWVEQAQALYRIKYGREHDSPEA